MDYGGANVAKELHIGHLRSPIIGEALYRLNKLMGNKVISDTHLGDWGLQMGLTELQLFEDGLTDGYFKNQGNKGITLDMELINPEEGSDFPYHATDIRNMIIQGDYMTLEKQFFLMKYMK